MKTCPYNREDLVESSRLLELSIRVPSARRALIDYDDQIGAGMRNPVKRWWLDLEIINNSAGAPLVVLGGSAKKHADDCGITEIQVSLTHSREYAAANAVVIAG
jgi:hypothetical protein